MKVDNSTKKIKRKAAMENKLLDKRRKELLRNYEHKVHKAEVMKEQKLQEIIKTKQEIDRMKFENVRDNHKREKRKLMHKKLTVIEKGKSFSVTYPEFVDIIQDRSKPLLKTDKINKEILNIKHKNREVMSKTLSQLQTVKPLEAKKVKKIVENVLPDLNVDELIKEEKEEDKKTDEV